MLHLCEILHAILKPDPTGKVVGAYKQVLGEEHREELVEVFRKDLLDMKVLLPTMETCMVDRLGDKQLNVKEDITNVLGWTEDKDGNYLSDLPWFNAFPKGIPMSAFVSVYKIFLSEGDATDRAGLDDGQKDEDEEGEEMDV